MSETTVFVSIGRNVGNGELPFTVWVEFQRVITHTLPDRLGATVLGRYPAGTGYWDGKREQSAGALWSIPTENLDDLRARLVNLARRFQQASIGLTIHDERHGPSYT